MVGEQFILQSNGLGIADRIRIHITGSRGGGPVEMAKGIFGPTGNALDAFGAPIPNTVPLDLSGVQGAAALPEFPQAAYQAAESVQAKIEVVQKHQKALAAAQVSGGGSLEETLIDAALNYCYSYLGFSPVDVADKYVVTKSDVQLDKASLPTGGTEFTIRLASRFGR